MNHRFLSVLVLVLVMCMAVLPLASAHRVHVQGQVGQIDIRAWYGGGDPMAGADVSIYTIRDGEDEPYLEGTTDEDGMFAFTPQTGVAQYRVVVEATGHRGETVVDLTGSTGQEAELPLYMRVIAGFGYLLGMAGAGMLYAGWKLKKQHENQ